MKNLKVLDVGGNLGLRAHKAYPEAEITVLDRKTGFDVTKEDFPGVEWDVVLSNHLIEHLENPDDFLDKCYRVMDDNSILDISTPNLLAWFNRLVVMFGYLPHSYEVSYRHNVGKPFKWGTERIGGHLRVTCPRALKQLLERHGFEVLSVKGEHSTYPCHPLIGLIDRLLTINPNLASSFRIKCKKTGG